MLKNKNMKLFSSSFILSAFTFGGGFVIIPLMQKKFVEQLSWIEEDEMIDLVSIAQASPGALTVNAAVLVGYKVAGLKGAIYSALGSILPPLLIITGVSLIYEMFIVNPIVQKLLIAMNIGVAAILIDVVYDLAKSSINDFKIYAVIVMIIVFILAYIKVNIILIIFLGGISGYLYFTSKFIKRKQKERE